MSKHPPTESIIHLNKVKAYRLAGNRRIAIRISHLEAALALPGATEEKVARSAKDCHSCRDLVIDVKKSLDSDWTDYRFRCGRERAGQILTCPDGVKVFVNSDWSLAEYEPITVDLRLDVSLTGTRPSKIFMNEFDSLPTGTPRCTEFTNELRETWSNEEDGRVANELSQRKNTAKALISKDLPQTLETDTW